MITIGLLGGLHSADCLLYSVDFAPIAALKAEGRRRRLLPAARSRRSRQPRNAPTA